MTPTKSPQEKEKRRGEILEAAIALFSEKGYAQTPVSEIVRQAGIAQGTFYLYFSSKEDLIMALVEKISRETLGEAMARAAQFPSPLERIELLVEASIRGFSLHRDLIPILYAGRGSAALHEEDTVLEQQAELIEVISQWIDEGIKMGEMRQQNSRYAAFFLLSLVHEVGHQTLERDLPAPMDETIPELMAFIRAALGR